MMQIDVQHLQKNSLSGIFFEILNKMAASCFFFPLHYG